MQEVCKRAEAVRRGRLSPDCAEQAFPFQEAPEEFQYFLYDEFHYFVAFCCSETHYWACGQHHTRQYAGIDEWATSPTHFYVPGGVAVLQEQGLALGRPPPISHRLEDPGAVGVQEVPISLPALPSGLGQVVRSGVGLAAFARRPLLPRHCAGR